MDLINLRWRVSSENEEEEEGNGVWQKKSGLLYTARLKKQDDQNLNKRLEINKYTNKDPAMFFCTYWPLDFWGAKSWLE